MQRIAAKVGQHFRIGPWPVYLALARGGDAVLYVATEPTETVADLRRAASHEKKLARGRAKDYDSGKSGEP
jgi:hypothetical protein